MNDNHEVVEGCGDDDTFNDYDYEDFGDDDHDDEDCDVDEPVDDNYDDVSVFTQLGLVCQTCSVYLTVCVSIER